MGTDAVRHVERNGLGPARLAGCIAAALMAGLAGLSQQSPSPNAMKPLQLPEVNRMPDANQQMEMRNRQSKERDFASANAERKKQIANDSARMLKLANEVKSEIEKTNKDRLSMSVIRKTDEIERLARDVRAKMQLSVGPG